MIKFQRRTAEEKNCVYPVEIALSKNYVQWCTVHFMADFLA